MSETSASLDRAALARLLSETVGIERAEASIDEAARGLGISLDGFIGVPRALEILERIAQTPGIVGITARFAKSRVHLVAAELRRVS